MKHIKSLHIDTEMTWRGGEQQALYLVKTLNEQGEPPFFVCQKGSELSKKLKSEGIEYHELKMRGELDVFSAIRIAAQVNKSSADIVHAHTSHAHSLAVIASPFYKKKVKLVVSRRVDFELKKNFLNKIKYSVPDKFLTVSAAIKDVMINCGVRAEKIEVVHSGVDINKFTDASKEPLIKEFALSGKEIIIGNIAHLADHKGQKYLISAFSLLLQEMNNVKLFIVGHGELEKELKNQVKELGIERSVIFTGFRKDVGNFLKLFDVFVMSSHLEGLGTTVLDALIAKTPVVATDAGGIPEMIKDGFNGRLVKKKDSLALKNAIKDIINNPEIAKEYAKNGYSFACENFDYHTTAKKTLNIYKELLSC